MLAGYAYLSRLFLSICLAGMGLALSFAYLLYLAEEEDDESKCSVATGTFWQAKKEADGCVAWQVFPFILAFGLDYITIKVQMA